MAQDALDLDAITTFGELLRHLRRRARLTQQELGTAVGYSYAHIARLANRLVELAERSRTGHESQSAPQHALGAQMPIALHVRLLGDFGLVYGAEPVPDVNAPRLQSLLAYLILHRDAPQSRQHLAYTLWPDVTVAQALNSLRQILHQLRHALRMPGAAHFLHTDSNTVHWQTGATVDGIAKIERGRALMLASGALFI